MSKDSIYCYEVEQFNSSLCIALKKMRPVKITTTLAAIGNGGYSYMNSVEQFKASLVEMLTTGVTETYELAFEINDIIEYPNYAPPSEDVALWVPENVDAAYGMMRIECSDYDDLVAVMKELNKIGRNIYKARWGENPSKNDRLGYHLSNPRDVIDALRRMKWTRVGSRRFATYNHTVKVDEDIVLRGEQSEVCEIEQAA